MKSLVGAAAISICLIGVSACAPTQTSSSFSSSESMRAQPVSFGQVINVRSVDIRPGQTRLGMATGAVLGGIAGSQIGGGTASNVAGGVAGAVAGGALGSAIQGSRVTRGIEVTLRLEGDNRTVAIIQPGDMRDFRIGDRVRLIGNADNARVAH
ncbi:glycine zipper 2TM domain-containing protein [Phenylobacterium sp.]|jgi:outer membrane lipoprotein SlyB|uniref:glycine zipper 2TM domain-containing protein n=1 Tax=Phenylobacterium sp. TaxID=1871053 RepID=UPI002F3E84A1